MASENKTVGAIVCPFTGINSPVKLSNKNKLYFYNKEIGIVQPLNKGFQAWVIKHATFNANYQALYADPDAAAEKEAAARMDEAMENFNNLEKPAPEKPEKKKGLIDTIFGEW